MVEERPHSAQQVTFVIFDFARRRFGIQLGIPHPRRRTLGAVGFSQYTRQVGGRRCTATRITTMQHCAYPMPIPAVSTVYRVDVRRRHSARFEIQPESTHQKTAWRPCSREYNKSGPPVGRVLGVGNVILSGKNAKFVRDDVFDYPAGRDCLSRSKSRIAP
jgi:hypothetical protein